MSAVNYQDLRGKCKGLVDEFCKEKRGDFMQRSVISLFLVYLLQVALQFREADEVREGCS